MSLALARKYRPQQFDDLIGQESVSRTLSLALDQDRLGHAYLFSGLRGSGKTSTARIFAKALLCEKGPTSKPCDQCPQCQAANEGRHIDIIEMDAASSRKIDDIRDLIEHTKYKPSVGRFKIFIIDEVHMLTKEAFNALLKTLEEPPSFVKFILATTDPLKLPATIISRTQHFRFKKIAKTLVVRHLEHILHTEEVSFAPEALEILARSGGGSLRDTLTLLDQAIVYAKGHIDTATITQMLGIVDPAYLQGLFEDILHRRVDRIRQALVELEAYEASMVLDEISLFLKERLLMGDPNYSPLLLERFYRIIADGKALLAIGSDGDFVLGLTLFKCIEALEIKEIDAMIEALEQELCPPTSADAPTLSAATPSIMPTAPSPAPTTTTKRAPTPPKTAPNTPTPKQEEPEQRFKQLIQKLYDRNVALGEAFEHHVRFLSYHDGVLAWQSHAQGEQKRLLSHNFGLIRQFVWEIFGIGTKIVLQKPSMPKETDTAPQESPPKPKEAIHNSKEERHEEQPATTPSSQSTQQEPPPSRHPAQSASTATALQGGEGSCVQEKCDGEDTPKELDAQEILNDPMVQKATELFGAKKIKIRAKI